MNVRGLGGAQRVALGIVATLLLPVVTVGLLVLVVTRLTDLPEGVALRVGHTDVSEQELRQRRDAFEALYGIKAPSGGPARDGFIRESAKAVAVSIVIDQAAKQRGIVISDEAARDAVDQLIARKFGPGGHDAFVTLLGEVGASMRNVLDEIKRQQSFNQLVSQVTGGVPEPTEADARALYRADPTAMVLPAQRRLTNVVVSSESDAQMVLRRARSGTDFGTLAKALSLDRASRDVAGDLGYVTREQLEDPYGQAAFAAPAGALFGPVRTKSGWNVGKVAEIRPEIPLAFEQVQEQLRDGLRGERQTKAWNDWLGRQLREADVTYADNYRPVDPDGAPTLSPAGAAATGQLAEHR
ncbi:MAG: peptidyl-prolyl cis-trans isomerase [Pseudonocardiales bacterium]|nr:peptidyl-prolyl cis-trans isomerase [Pseudonocardiales bacterium]